ncbi:MAG: hypothetical protein GX956_04170 [Firmicutes bacterium]|nr:hypothetical protein [Bacillota bacterium]
MNKAITIGLLGLLVFFTLQGQQGKVDDQALVVEPAVNYLSFAGTITDIRGDEGQRAILVQDENNADNSIVFNLSDNVLLLDANSREVLKDGFAVGQEITAYYPENTPMALSLPPITTPKVIVLNSEVVPGFIHVATFDETLTSSDGQLKLNISTKTKVTDGEGNPVTTLANRELVVFYTISTRSIPAQTTPERIFVIK